MYKNSQQNINMVSVYDGNKIVSDIDYNINGESKHYHVQLDNKDIQDILGTQPVMKSLEQRLIEDFNMPQSFKKSYSKKRTNRHKNKTQRKKKISSKKNK